MNGAPSANVPLMVNGMQLAHAVDGAGTRSVSTNNLSINNMSRLEIVFTPTPETPGSALAGSINLVPRSAFDRAKPTFNYAVAAVMRDRERTLKATPGLGGRGDATHKITPELSFSSVVPLNDRMGFTFSASTTTTRNTRSEMRHFWRGVFNDTNGGTYPDTTPDKPYLWSIGVLDGLDELVRRSVGGSFDIKIGERGRLSFATQFGQFNIGSDNNVLTYEILRVNPGAFSDTFTQGAPGQGLLRQNRNYGYRRDTTWLDTLNFNYDGKVWRIESGLGYSTSDSVQTYQTNSDFADSVVRRQNVTIRFDDQQAFLPRATITDGTTGAPVDPTLLSNYTFVSSYRPNIRNYGVNRRAFASLRREFDLRVPLTVKAGFSVDDIQRDHVNFSSTLTHVGRDGVASNADDSAAGAIDAGLSGRPFPYGWPQPQWVDSGTVTDLYRSNPNYFTSNAVGDHNTYANNSKYARETVSAAYLRADTNLLESRLKIVVGLRAEQTNVEGEGNKQDATANYQRDASGKVVLGSNGQPLLLNPANSVEAVRLTNKARGFKAEKEYLRWFPSLNASYNITDSFLVRGGYFHSVGRPSFVQYAGSLTLPNLDSPPSPSNRITVNNVGIKAWDARSFKLSLEYYFKDVGILQVSGFTRQIENFFGTTIFAATPEFLSLYNLDGAQYSGYEVSTQYNLPGTVRMSGYTVDYKQALTFLPEWARGVQVFGNISGLRTQGAESANLAGYIPRSINWGITLSRPKFTLRARWNYESESRQALAAPGRSIGPSVYQWRTDRLAVSIGGEYRVWRGHALYFDITNLTNEPFEFQYYGPSTPEWAQRRTYTQTTPLVTFGVKGSF
jgi:TonB-dependent receptor